MGRKNMSTGQSCTLTLSLSPWEATSLLSYSLLKILLYCVSRQGAGRFPRPEVGTPLFFARGFDQRLLPRTEIIRNLLTRPGRKPDGYYRPLPSLLPVIPLPPLSHRPGMHVIVSESFNSN